MKNININSLSTKLNNFLVRHRTTIFEITTNSSNIFEAFCFVIFVRYYEEIGCKVKVKNLLEGKFRFKFSTSGYPWNYSYFIILILDNGKEETLFEIRHNQKVAGAYIKISSDELDPPMFAVDVAVIKYGGLPDLPQGFKRKDENYWVNNEDLITFGEAKKLTAYPMLLAQFVGIVHEIKPEYLNKTLRDNISEINHPPPVLFTANHLTRGSQNVLETFSSRNLQITLVDDVTGSSEKMLLKKMGGGFSETNAS